MSRIYRTKFTRPGRLPRERRSMGQPHTGWLLRLLKFKETLLVGTLKGAFEDAQQKHRMRIATPKIIRRPHSGPKKCAPLQRKRAAVTPTHCQRAGRALTASSEGGSSAMPLPSICERGHDFRTNWAS